VTVFPPDAATSAQVIVESMVYTAVPPFHPTIFRSTGDHSKPGADILDRLSQLDIVVSVPRIDPLDLIGHHRILSVPKVLSVDPIPMILFF
jgi:hypothetical protein